MIAFAKPHRAPRHATWQEGFLQLLPRLRWRIRRAFANLRGEAYHDAVQEAIALACLAYVRLWETGKEHLAYAGPLARYAVRHFYAGRKAGVHLNSGDVLSPYAQRLRGIRVYHPDGRDDESAWHHLLTEDGRCTPAELAASRIDFAAWLDQLPRVKRRIAETLSTGETTLAAARRHRLTPGRISQVRGELARNWNSFHGEDPLSPVGD